MKKLFLFLLVFSFTNISQAEFVVIDNLSYELDDTSLTAKVAWGFYAFEKLSEANIPETVTYNSKTYSVTSIADRAFKEVTTLKSVVIPNSVTSVGSSAFIKCTGLTNVKLGNSITTIKEKAFNECMALTSIEIPNSVTEIGVSAFSGCTGLTNVKLGNSITQINEYTFYKCKALTSIDIPNSVMIIGKYAFYSASNLASVNFGNSIIEIHSHAFDDCSALTSIEIPESVKFIEYGAFTKCQGLKVLTINSNTLSLIGGENFFSCDNLERIICHCTIPPFVGDPNDTFPDEIYKNAILYVPRGFKSIFSSKSPWNKFKTIREQTDITIMPVISVGDKIILSVDGVVSDLVSDSRSWSSSDVGIASVNAEGVVTGVSEGIATISVKHEDGTDAYININVVSQGARVESVIYLNEDEYEVYSTSGIQLLHRASKDDLKSLVPGVYIINGKKTLVK